MLLVYKISRKRGNAMDSNSRGIKRICLGCATRFYDFNKSPIVCPQCGTIFDPEYLSKRKTKNSQEKHDDVDIEIVDDVLADDQEDGIVELDDENDEVITES
jgi:uncharacterized protein (TIGR02300 family)